MMGIKQELKDLHEWRQSELQSIEGTFNDKFADIMQKLKSKAEKKGPVVPWVGALIALENTYPIPPMTEPADPHPQFYTGWTISPRTKVVLIDHPLIPQFMPNDGVNPWPDDMEVEVITKSRRFMEGNSREFTWGNNLGNATIIGSRPACGWAEYLKERE